VGREFRRGPFVTIGVAPHASVQRTHSITGRRVPPIVAGFKAKGLNRATSQRVVLVVTCTERVLTSQPSGRCPGVRCAAPQAGRGFRVHECVGDGKVHGICTAAACQPRLGHANTQVVQQGRAPLREQHVHGGETAQGSQAAADRRFSRQGSSRCGWCADLCTSGCGNRDSRTRSPCARWRRRYISRANERQGGGDGRRGCRSRATGWHCWQWHSR